MDSFRSNAGSEPAPAVEEEWQIISAHWWRTPFSSVSWSYEPEKASQNVVCAKPPYYHLALHDEGAHELSNESECFHRPLKMQNECPLPLASKITGEDDTLNMDLIGVKGTSDILRIYEQAVGFDLSPWSNLNLRDMDRSERLRICVSEADVEAGKQRWDESVENLIGGVPLRKLLEEARKGPKVVYTTETCSTPPRSTIDYFSRPSTPKPSRLNPSASSFVPLGSPTSTFSSTESSSYSDASDQLVLFSFPSLNGSLSAPPNDKKYHQERVNYLHSRSRTTSSDGSSVASNDRPSSVFFPSFLFDPTNQRRRPIRISRTRALVDELRSQHQHDGISTSRVSQSSSPTASDFGPSNMGCSKSRLTVSDGSSVCSTSPPLTEDEHQHPEEAGISVWSDHMEGWIVPPAPVVVDPETKRTRSKELLMTLRRRTDSLNSNCNATANLAAARSLGAVPASASATSMTLGCDRLVKSPEPFENESAMAVAGSQVHEEQEEIWSKMSNLTHGSANSYNSLPSSAPSTLNVTASPFAGYKNTRVHAQTPTHGQALPGTANASIYTQGYFASPPSWLPYTLLGYPAAGIPMSLGLTESMSVPAMPMPVTTATPRVGMQIPVQVPVQVPVQSMQYSTLMHLRIMQQVQMMRNSMCMGSGLQSSSSGVMR